VTVVARDAGGLDSPPLRLGLRTKGSRILSVPGEYASIQAAVDGASAGDSIEIANGTYRESLHVTKTLKLVGADRETCRIEASGHLGPALTVDESADVTLQDLTFLDARVRPRSQLGFGSEGVRYDTEKWSVLLQTAPADSTPARKGIRIGTALTRVDGVSITGWDHVQQAYIQAAAAHEDFSLDYTFADGQRLTESCECRVLVRVRHAKASLRRVTLTTAAHVALLASGQDTLVQASEVHVPRATHGLVAVEGARLLVTASRFSSTQGAGVQGVGAGTEVEVDGCQFEDLPGVAIELVGALTARVLNNRATGCEFGLTACGPSAGVDTVGNDFSRNRKNGIFYTWGATGLIENNTCDHNGAHGIDTCGLGTTPRITGNRTRFNKMFGVVW
jgi:hypothetical protein